MYVAMLLVIFGQAIVFASRAVALYGVGAFLFFHVSVIRIEEPHLRAKQGAAWDDYARRVPRWLGLPQ
jgi:protein-S-isoprenylcysteine O-methyltransferase Ste14